MSTSTYNIIAEILKSRNFRNSAHTNCFHRSKPNISVLIEENPKENWCEIHIDATFDGEIFFDKVVRFKTISNSILVEKISGDKNPELDIFTLDLVNGIIDNPHRVRYVPSKRIIPDPRPAQELLKKIERRLKSCRLEIVPHCEGRYYDIVAKVASGDDSQLELNAVATEEIVTVDAYYRPDPEKDYLVAYSARFNRGEDGLFSPEKAIFKEPNHRVKNPLAEKIIKYIQTAVFE